MSNKLVKDYLGNLVPKDKARKILGKYYVEGETCFLMEDSQWYRVTSSDKIIYDHFVQKYVLKGTGHLVKGLINDKSEEGYFSDNDMYVVVKDKRSGESLNILNEKIAESLGYVESIYDGLFYKKSSLTEKDLKEWFNKKHIPNHERSKSYNLESDPQRKKELEEIYKNLEIKIPVDSKRLAKLVGDYSFGMEAEVINGFIPRRIRNKLGIKALKDGSLRSDNGEGIEMVTMPMEGPKGIEVIRQFCKELTKRCEVNNYCSVHFHFGKVRKDKLFALSIYRLGSLLQNELIQYFPYSRFNSIKPDGKVYCGPLQPLNIDYGIIFKQKTEEDFHNVVNREFNKLYTWLNNGKELASVHGEPALVRTNVVVEGKKMFYDKWLKNIYSTKSVYHSISGEKWNRPQRYVWLNLLNLYFSKIGTVEFRAEPGSTNFTKVIIWMLTCASILKYAEDVKRCLTVKSVTLKEVLVENLGDEYANYIMEYYKLRHEYFFDKNGQYRNYKAVEAKWFNEDPQFSFQHNNMEIK